MRLQISVGNVHRLQESSCSIDFQRLQNIEAQVAIPLVIHGTTGIKEDDLLRLKSMGITKFNTGTSLRKVIGDSLRMAMQAEPNKFDRQYFMSKVQVHAQAEVERILLLLG